MIDRSLEGPLRDALARFPAVALLGPRQVGKTTLARTIFAGAEPPVYLDLENAIDQARLADSHAFLAAHAKRLVILDEVQQAPELFRALRGIIDERIHGENFAGRFLLLGSASIDLLRQSSESLAGRIAYLELHPFDVAEVGTEHGADLWLRGGFPRSFLATGDAESAVWRENFLRTYLERDIPALGPRIPAQTLRRFWTMLAHAQGSMLNAAGLAASLGIDGKTVARYLDLLVDLLLVRRLPPYHANVKKRLVKSPKVYVRDSGVLHALLRIDDMDQLLGHPVAGASWEGFVLETIAARMKPRSELFFYRTATGVEIDAVLDRPGGELWAIEIKRNLPPSLSRGLLEARNDLRPARTFVVYPGREAFPMGEGVEAIGLAQLIELVSR